MTTIVIHTYKNVSTVQLLTNTGPVEPIPEEQRLRQHLMLKDNDTEQPGKECPGPEQMILEREKK